MIITGDFNTAHHEIDLKNPGPNSDRSGFLRIERDVLDRMVDEGYVDTFRHFYPEAVKYSWWSYRFTPGKTMPGGASTIFLSPGTCLKKAWLQMPLSTMIFLDPTIAPSD